MFFLYLLTGLAVIASCFLSFKKTFKALKIAWKKFFKILPAFLSMLMIISIVLFMIPDHLIIKYLGHKNLGVALVFAAVFGSITIMPGFIAFPLSGILLSKGVSYMVLSAFTTTLMTVGILTYPVEKEYFGAKVTIIRNVVALCAAIVVAAVTGFLFGELEF